MPQPDIVLDELDLFGELDDAAEAEAIAEAEADVAAGRVVPHEEVVRWLESWFTPDGLPCPKPH